MQFLFCLVCASSISNPTPGVCCCAKLVTENKTAQKNYVHLYQMDNEPSEEVKTTMLSYIVALCTSKLADLKLCTTAYHTQHKLGLHVHVDVLKYPLPGNAFMLVVKKHRPDNLFEAMSGCYEGSEQEMAERVWYCIGDITSKLMPLSQYSNWQDHSVAPAYTDYSSYCIFNRIYSDYEQPRFSYLEYVYVYMVEWDDEFENLADKYDGDFNDIKKLHCRRFNEHFNALCALSLPPPLRIQGIDRLSNERKLAALNHILVVNGHWEPNLEPHEMPTCEFSEQGKRIINNAFKDHCPLII